MFYKLLQFEFRYHVGINPIADLQDKSREWALENAENEEPNLDKLAIITNQTPLNIHCIMDEGGLEIDFLPLHWLPQNTEDFAMLTENEQIEIEKKFTYVGDEYIYDSGKYLFLLCVYTWLKV